MHRDELILAIKTVYTGKRFISPTISQKLAISKFSSKSGQFSNLSDREMEVMGMVIRGVDVKKIAQRLHVTDGTVHSYRSRIFQKLLVKSDLELLVKALRSNIINIDEINFN